MEANFYLFGNKGNVWSETTHIAHSGDGTYRTMCGTPMLSSNWAMIAGITEPGCPECIKLYEEKTKGV